MNYFRLTRTTVEQLSQNKKRREIRKSGIEQGKTNTTTDFNIP